VTAAAAALFTEPPRQKAAIAYLRQRGIDAYGLSAEWVLGYAPPGWTRLVDRLRL
jgi:DNA primase